MKIIDTIRLDIAAAGHSCRGAHDLTRLYLRYPGINFVVKFRLISALYALGSPMNILALILWNRFSRRSGSEISLEASISPGIYIPHPYGIVIGRCFIGEGVTIQQGVTVGVRQRGDGTSPVIEEGCSIGAGAAVLGDVRVGKGAVVGANSVVLVDIPAGAVAVGAPARVIHSGGNLGDPVSARDLTARSGRLPIN